MSQEITRSPAPAAPTAADARPDRSFSAWSGWCGLVATAAFVVTIVAGSASGAPAPEGPGEILGFLDEVSQTPATWYAYGVAGIALTVLYIPMAVAVHRLLASSTASWFASTAVVVGLAALFPAYVVNVLVPAGLAPAAGVLGEGGAGTLYGIHAYADAAAEVCFAVGSVLSLGVGPLLWGVGWLRSVGAHRWLGWAQLITGATGMVWFVWLLADSVVVTVLLAVNGICALVVFTGISAVLVGRGRPRG